SRRQRYIVRLYNDDPPGGTVGRKATQISVTLQRDPATRLSEQRKRLLAAIRVHGSISAAAREVGLSYKAAWDAVRAMNTVFGRPLVKANPGGRHGGFAILIPAGERVLAALAVVEAELGRWLGRLQRHL